MTFEDKTVKELMSLLQEVAPEVTTELRNRLKELEREIYHDGYEAALEAVTPTLTTDMRDQLKEEERRIYSDGFSAGLDEGVLRATIPDESFLLKGEAKGLNWAYYAASGAQVTPNTNPFVSPNIIKKLLALGEKAKAEKEA